MQREEINKIVADLKNKYPETGIQSIEVDEKTGKAVFNLLPTKKTLAFLEKNAVIPRIYRDKAAVINRDVIDRTSLDLMGTKDPYTDDPKNLFKRAMRYHVVEPLVGSTNNLLASLASKGFENDIDDPDIKNFYDVWSFDVNFEEIISWIFLDLCKIGQVTTYKAIAKYEPRVSNMSPAPGKKLKKTASDREFAAKKNIWSKGHLPVAYTVLNPLLVNIEGNLLFDNVRVSLTPPTELKDLLKKSGSELTIEEKELIKMLPSDLKNAAEKGAELVLDSRLVGSITYRKQPYERYAKPRITRIFDSLEYKNALRQADLSTLDGITNYILKVTIGNDMYPATDQAALEAVAALFNTSSKSFDVVWNHTLKVEKIISPEIDKILGKAKYEQVNDDITGGLSITRALIDGVGDVGTAEASLLTKGLMEEINYLRKQVERWIYDEYRQIADTMGFDRFPKVRWDEGILKDTILYMATISQLVDRRMLSYRTAHEVLGFDFTTEKKNMEDEFTDVESGIFGIIGSPWQQSKVQSVQGAPVGTPSNGRPSGKPATKKTTETDPQKKLNKSTDKKTTSFKSNDTLKDVVLDMTKEEYELFKQHLDTLRKEG